MPRIVLDSRGTRRTVRCRRAVHRAAAIGAMLAIGLTLAGPSGAGAGELHFRHCGTLPGPGARFAIFAYKARCRTARRVFHTLFAGGGRRWFDPRTGKTYRLIDGWTCGSAAGGFSCAKPGPGGRTTLYGPSLNAAGM
jgi:hypothetical protein